MTGQTRDILRDAIADIRFSRRCIAAGQNVQEEQQYLKGLIADFKKLWATRHNVEYDRFGWPKIWAESQREQSSGIK